MTNMSEIWLIVPFWGWTRLVLTHAQSTLLSSPPAPEPFSQPVAAADRQQALLFSRWPLAWKSNGQRPTRAEVMGQGFGEWLKYHFYQVCFVWAKSLLGPLFCFSPDEGEGVGKNEMRQKMLEVKGFEIRWMWVQVLALLLTNRSVASDSFSPRLSFFFSEI